MEMIEIHLMEMVLTWPDECYQIVNCVFATSIKLVNTLMKYNVQEILVSYYHDHMGEDRTPRWFAMKFILFLLSFIKKQIGNDQITLNGDGSHLISAIRLWIVSLHAV